MTFVLGKNARGMLLPGVRAVILLGIMSSVAACRVNESDRAEIETVQSIPLTDPCRKVKDYEFYSIEHFELGVGRSWWVSSDGTGTMGELPGREPAATEIPGGRCGVSRYGLKITAEDLAVYGGAFGRNYYPSPFDASQWEGISFWAKRGNDTADKKLGRSVYFSVGDKYTDERNGVREWADGKPYCYDEPEDPADKCDRFGMGLGIETEWQFYTVAFEDMTQRGFGKAAPELFVEGIIGLDFSFETGDWELWVDDVAYYREKQ